MARLIKILCHSCSGRGYVEETEYETKATVSVECPECDGEGYVLAKKWEPDQKAGAEG